MFGFNSEPKAFDICLIKRLAAYFRLSCKQAKRKRIAELSVSTLPLQNHQNSHWDCVLEEMSWLANDFAQV